VVLLGSGLFVPLVFEPRVRRVGIVLRRQASHRKGDGTRCKGYCFHSGGKLANSKGDEARCHRSFDSRAPDGFPGPFSFVRAVAQPGRVSSIYRAAEN